MRLPSPRLVHLGFVLIVIGLWAYALYAQYVLHFDPCPLCVLQRLAFALFGAIALLALLQNPRATGQKIYGALLAIAGLIGVGIAGRHVWLQHLPADQVPTCSNMSLDFMLDVLPLTETIRRTFTGSAECAKVDWTFAGLSMPEWTLLWFIALAVLAVWNGFRRVELRG
jgi:protein dithiol:quinone oxidoreductase